VDLKGWGYANCDVRAYIAAIEIMQNYYPERLGKALMIHVPYIFMKAWNMVKPFIDANTKDKVCTSSIAVKKRMYIYTPDRSWPFLVCVTNSFLLDRLCARCSSCSSTTRTWRKR
jgi:hypothetical protein